MYLAVATELIYHWLLGPCSIDRLYPKVLPEKHPSVLEWSHYRYLEEKQVQKVTLTKRCVFSLMASYTVRDWFPLLLSHWKKRPFYKNHVQSTIRREFSNSTDPFSWFTGILWPSNPFSKSRSSVISYCQWIWREKEYQYHHHHD